MAGSREMLEGVLADAGPFRDFLEEQDDAWRATWHHPQKCPWGRFFHAKLREATGTPWEKAGVNYGRYVWNKDEGYYERNPDARPSAAYFQWDSQAMGFDLALPAFAVTFVLRYDAGLDLPPGAEISSRAHCLAVLRESVWRTATGRPALDKP